jgi:Tol biopolymer transport system component
LWRVPAGGGSPRRIEGVGANAYGPTVAPRGSRLAYTNGFANANLWSIDLSGKSHASGPPRLIVASKGENALSSFSPDGRRIAFESSRSGFNEIWLANHDGSNPVQLTFLNGDAGTPRWSQDSRYVAFDYRPKEHSEVYVTDVAGGAPRMVITHPGSDNFVPNFSRDGQWLYFASTHESEVAQIWKIPSSGGKAIKLTAHGGTAPVEGGDGFVYYSRSMASDEVWKISPRGGKEILVMKGTGLTCWCGWALDPKGIYFVSAKHKLDFFDFASRKVQEIATLGEKAGNPAISPDGKSVLYSQMDLLDETIMLVNNFR